MPRWLRLARGVLGTGITFSMVVSGVFGALGLGRWLLFGGDLDLRFLLVETILTGAAPFGFVSGVLFSGALALTARGRGLGELSLRHLGALGAGAAVFLSVVVIGVPTSTLQWIVQGGVFALVGGGTAAGSLMLARRAEGELKPAADSRTLGADRRPDGPN